MTKVSLARCWRWRLSVCGRGWVCRGAAVLLVVAGCMGLGEWSAWAASEAHANGNVNVDAAANGHARPPSPAGYHWVPFPTGTFAYLAPDGWFHSSQRDGEVATLFISKEQIEQVGSYRTGLSINVIRGVSERAGLAPSEFAQRTIAKTAGSQQEGLTQWTTPQEGGGLHAGFRSRDRSPMPSLMIHTVLVADDQADTLQILVFTAPESEWDQAWARGELIVTQIHAE